MYQLVRKKCASWYAKNVPAGTKKMYQPSYELTILTYPNPAWYKKCTGWYEKKCTAVAWLA